MNYIVIALGLVMIVVGVVGVVNPARLLAYAEWWKTPSRIQIAAVLRISLGIAFWYAAPQTEYVTTLRVFAVLMVVAGLGFFIAGPARVLAMLDWWLGLSPIAHRAWLLTAVLFGVFLVVAGR